MANGRFRFSRLLTLSLLVVIWSALTGIAFGSDLDFSSDLDFGSDLDVAEKLSQRALEDDRAWDLVAALTSEVGPRPAGSTGDRRAVAWALERMEAMGFENVRAEPVTVPHWEAGVSTGRIVTPHPQKLVLTALGGSVGTAEGGIEAEVVEVASQEALMAMDPDRLVGKIVFVNHR
ncbi:MAG: peptidase M28 family protein, partial [Thermoanaerobaculia bacterium]|nr:peptidase M28 family protein [Thermoanaerobaculia bacterium]